MSFARDGDFVVQPHDFEVGVIRAVTEDATPGVVQLCADHVAPDDAAVIAIAALNAATSELALGAPATVDAGCARLLPTSKT